MLELAAAPNQQKPMNSVTIAAQRGIPEKYLAHILLQLKRAGLVRSNPSVKPAGNSLKPERPRLSYRLSLTRGLSFQSHAKRAEGAARECGRVLRILQKDLRRLGKQTGSPRQRAMAKLSLNLYPTPTLTPPVNESPMPAPDSAEISKLGPPINDHLLFNLYVSIGLKRKT